MDDGVRLGGGEVRKGKVTKVVTRYGCREFLLKARLRVLTYLKVNTYLGPLMQGEREQGHLYPKQTLPMGKTVLLYIPPSLTFDYLTLPYLILQHLN